MNAIKLFVVFVLIIVALFHQRHQKPQHMHDTKARPVAVKTAALTPAQTAVNKEILQNAERLAETIRKCKQTQNYATK